MITLVQNIKIDMKTLRKGCRGSEVKTLQGYLNLIQDGIFGVLTEESAKEFQSSNGLTADDGYIIANVLHGFDAENYIGTKTMVLPAEREVSGLVAITEQQHNEYMKVIEEKMEAEMRPKREEVNDAQE